MAMLLTASGLKQQLRSTGKVFSLAEMQAAVGGNIEYVYLDDPGHVLVVDEDGRLRNKPVNYEATRIRSGVSEDEPVPPDIMCSHMHNIVGDALYVSTTELSNNAG